MIVIEKGELDYSPEWRKDIFEALVKTRAKNGLVTDTEISAWDRFLTPEADTGKEKENLDGALKDYSAHNIKTEHGHWAIKELITGINLLNGFKST